MAKKRVLVVGLGNMGMSHALAYTRIPGFEVVGVCTRHIADKKLPDALAEAKRFSNYEEALAELKPDVVSVNTLPDTHADFAIKAMEAGAHVFVEKPLAELWRARRRSSRPRSALKKKLVIGYILRLHPSWVKFIEIARAARHAAGLPHEPEPAVERRDLGVAQAAHGLFPADRRLRRPLCRRHVPDDEGEAGQRVHAMGVHLSEEVKEYNYGVLQVGFDDGSVGWYEAGWGPMMSETAFFVKDVIGPKGSVSIVMAENAGEREVRRHQRPHQDQPDPLAPRRHVEARRAHRHDRRAGP